MLILTERAVSVIRSIAARPEYAETGGLRIAAAPDGEQRLSVTAAQTPALGDQVIEDDGARVFLDTDAAVRLDDQVLDAVIDESNRIEFVLAAQEP
jgi:Fe-S cluster assembly iron-binding protein IscA